MGSLLIGGALCATPAQSQGRDLCADPRSFCGAAVPPQCATQLKIKEIAVLADSDCVDAVRGYRHCLREAADCPGVVDQTTPEAPREASVACATGDCAQTPQKPAIRGAPDEPEPSKDQQ